MMYTIPVLFLLAAGNVTLNVSLRLSEPVVGCVGEYRTMHNGGTEIHFECYTEEGKVIHRVISGVQKT